MASWGEIPCNLCAPKLRLSSSEIALVKRGAVTLRQRGACSWSCQADTLGSDPAKGLVGQMVTPQDAGPASPGLQRRRGTGMAELPAP